MACCCLGQRDWCSPDGKSVNSISITGFKPMLLTWRIFYKQQDDEETEEDEEEGTTPPVSLCVPWQMFVKEVANINTVLTYI